MAEDGFSWEEIKRRLRELKKLIVDVTEFKRGLSELQKKISWFMAE